MSSKLSKTIEPTSVTLQIVGMHCTSCAINIDFELEDLEGVMEAKTHYAKQISIVTYEPHKVTHEQMLEVISKLGYEAIVAEQG